MFATLITPERMSQIAEVEELPKPFRTITEMINSKPRPEAWYLIRGYVSEHGRVYDFATLPAHRFETHYEYDPDKIQTDWDQIVRK